MSGYFGTDIQQLLQQRAEQSFEFVRATPGACQAARMLATDEPDALQWSVIDDLLRRDGMFAFRMLDKGSQHAIAARLLDKGYRFDTWDVFVASAEETSALAGSAIELPSKYRRMPSPHASEGEDTRSLQFLMARCGVAPFSGSFLVGEIGPATTVAIADGSGEPVAVAHAYLPHNAHSPFHTYAWVGLVAVDERHRGEGLGTSVTSMAIRAACSGLGATHVYSLASPENVPSRRMLESCGLVFKPQLVCGVAVANASPRFSK
jgi:RimJ/RimL family protein N-acetyltransferase